MLVPRKIARGRKIIGCKIIFASQISGGKKFIDDSESTGCDEDINDRKSSDGIMRLSMIRKMLVGIKSWVVGSPVII